MSASEIQLLLKDLEALHSSTESAACRRTELILAVLSASEKFFDDFFAVSENLHELQDRLTSQAAPGLSPEAVKLQLKELQVSASVLFVCLTFQCLFFSLNIKDLIALISDLYSPDKEKFLIISCIRP